MYAKICKIFVPCTIACDLEKEKKEKIGGMEQWQKMCWHPKFWQCQENTVMNCGQLSVDWKSLARKQLLTFQISCWTLLKSLFTLKSES